MTCILDRPDPATLFDRVKQMFAANVLGGAPVLPDTNEWYAVSNDYLAQQMFYSLAEQMWRETNPEHACQENLEVWGRRRGIYPRPATFAAGYVRVSGTVGAALDTGMRVQFGDIVYRVDPTSGMPPEIPPTGFAVIAMTAETPGVDGNGSTLTSLTGTLLTPLDGVSDEVHAYGRFCGGQAPETLTEYRARVLHRIAHPHQTRIDRVIEDLRKFPCLTRALPRDCSCCTERGRMDLFVFFDNTFEHGIPPENVIEDMTNWYFGVPQGIGRGLADWGQEGRFYRATAVPIDVTVSKLPCTSPAQMQEVRNRIFGLFKTLVPGRELCRAMIDALIVPLIGPSCDHSVVISKPNAGRVDTSSFKPGCDELPVAGTITITGGSLTV